MDAADRPHLVPITFVVDGDLVFHAVDHKPKRSTELKRLRNIAVNERVCVLCDHYAPDWARLWWVRADGVAEIWTDPNRRDPAVRMLAAKYPQYVEQPPAGPVVAITVTRWTGWAASR